MEEFKLSTIIPVHSSARVKNGKFVILSPPPAHWDWGKCPFPALCSHEANSLVARYFQFSAFVSPPLALLGFPIGESKGLWGNLTGVDCWLPNATWRRLIRWFTFIWGWQGYALCLPFRRKVGERKGFLFFPSDSYWPFLPCLLGPFMRGWNFGLTVRLFLFFFPPPNSFVVRWLHPY